MSSDSALPHFQAGTRVTPGRPGAEAYADAIAPIFDIGLRDVDAAGPDLGINSFNIGPLLLGQAHMSQAAFTYGRDARKIAATGLELILVQIIVDGEDVRRAGRDEITARPGDVCLLDLTRTFQSETARCTNINLALPRDAFDARDIDLDPLHGLVLRRESAGAQLLRSHAESLMRVAPDLRPDEAYGVGRATTDLLAGLTLGLRGAEARRAAADTQRARVRRFIDAHLADPDLGAERLCRQFGLSRASLYRLFAPLGGVSEHIRNRRLRRVFDALSDPAQPLAMAQVAERYGFTVWSSFSRAFKTRFGMTPGEARGQGATAAARASVLQAANGGLPDWLRALDAA
ncbi:helix-turn-helix domain-containing protein [Caulobacter sp. RL271]|jgi:AraC-like DNA-binding protein|uniref:Helix-turn-helix domain-containing protein n=1 Tax=Caulobacter segnis TaxID=88688 RepID=A0ABY4ZUV5_9CAUL|nr:helix-turn-helix domain-containing protein [Caulobacter segnis]USQ95721.1 helix-turn-helix domain-containing protein [Caulobacter segnis]